MEKTKKDLINTMQNYKVEYPIKTEKKVRKPRVKKEVVPNTQTPLTVDEIKEFKKLSLISSSVVHKDKEVIGGDTDSLIIKDKEVMPKTTLFSRFTDVLRQKAENRKLKEELAISKNQIAVHKEIVDKYGLNARPSWKIEKKMSWWQRRKLRKRPELSYIITMYFPNKTSLDFVIVGARNTFLYKNRTFVLDTKQAWFDLTNNQYHLFFYFDEALPVSNEVKPLPNYVYPATTKGNEAFLYVKSDNVDDVIQQEYVKIMASANQLNMYLKILLFLNVATLFFQIFAMIFIFMLSRNMNNMIKILSGGNA